MNNIYTDLTENPDSTAMRALTFGLQDEVFAIKATSVREIIDMVPATEVPGAPNLIGSLINVRGRAVPMVDLRGMFGMERAPADVDTRIVVTELALDGDAVIVGILADRVHEVSEIEITSIEEAPKVGMRWRPEYVRGIAKCDGEFIIIPDFGRILNSAGAQSSVTENKRTI